MDLIQITNSGTRCKWTTQDEQFLTDNYPKMGSQFCAKSLDKYPAQVIAKVKRMRLNRVRIRITEQQKDFVLQNYKTLSINQICEHEKLQHHQVYNLISRLGISLVNWIYFSVDDDNIIRDNIATLSNDEIGEILHRTGDSIHARMQKINLRRTPEQKAQIQTRLGNPSYFPKGHIPYNTKSDGEISIRIYDDAKSQKFIRISLAKWMPLQIFNWIQVNGPIPDGLFLRCISGDTMDCKPNNWELATRIEHLDKNLGRATLEDKYITTILSLKNRELRPVIASMPALIELKRNQIKIRRTINELT